MTVSAIDAIKVALAALMVGVAVPLLVQLFITLRSLRQAVATMDERLDRTMHELNELLARVSRAQAPPNETLSQVGAALIPAVVAAVRAYRAHHHTNGVAAPEATEEETR